MRTFNKQHYQAHGPHHILSTHTRGDEGGSLALRWLRPHAAATYVLMKITSAEKLLFLVRQLFGKAAVRKCGLHLYPYTLAWPAPCRSRAAQKDDRSRKRAAAGSSSGLPGSTWPAVNSFGMKIVAESKHVECSGSAQAAARNRDSLGAHQQQQHWPSVKMTRNIKNKSKLHIFGLNIIYEEHNGNLTLNCVLGRTKENKCNKNNSGKGYFCRDTFVFWAARCLAPLSYFPPLSLFHPLAEHTAYFWQHKFWNF